MRLVASSGFAAVAAAAAAAAAAAVVAAIVITGFGCRLPVLGVQQALGKRGVL